MDEKGGGILADEMGMGKSLSILSLVLRTLGISERWAREDNQAEGHTKSKRRSRATLVIVPSARK